MDEIERRKAFKRYGEISAMPKFFSERDFEPSLKSRRTIERNPLISTALGWGVISFCLAIWIVAVAVALIWASVR